MTIITLTKIADEIERQPDLHPSETPDQINERVASELGVDVSYVLIAKRATRDAA